jgi:hypothetical protein
MTVRVAGMLAIAAAVGLGCIGGENGDPGPPVMTLLSPKPLDTVAYRDGDGPWQPLENAFGVYRFDVHQPRFTLAFVCRSLGLGEVIQAATDDVAMIRVPCGDPLEGYGLTEPPRRRQGSIRGVGTGAQVTVSFGIYGISMPAEVTAAGYGIDLRPARYDLLAVAEESDGRTRVIVRHLIDPATQENLDLDFGSSEALAPVEQPIAAAGAPGERLQTGVTIMTRLGAKGVLLSRTPGQLPLLDQARLGPEDIQDVWLRGAATDTVQLRGVSQALARSSGPMLTLPPPVTGATAMAAASTPVVRPRVGFQPQPGALFYQLTIAQLVPQDTLTWVVNASSRALAGGSSLELPDLFALPGFAPALAPPPGVPLQLELTVVTSNRRMDILLDGMAAPAPGETTGFAKTVLSL